MVYLSIIDRTGFLLIMAKSNDCIYDPRVYLSIIDRTLLLLTMHPFSIIDRTDFFHARKEAVHPFSIIDSTGFFHTRKEAVLLSEVVANA